MFHVVGGFAEFERNIISERTRVGLATMGGKPKGLSADAQKKAIKAK
jgi:DNA invertase Pin-like site-specific DNA recombinase